jgi:hypothetical protein
MWFRSITEMAFFTFDVFKSFWISLGRRRCPRSLHWLQHDTEASSGFPRSFFLRYIEYNLYWALVNVCPCLYNQVLLGSIAVARVSLIIRWVVVVVAVVEPLRTLVWSTYLQLK